jgi:hypothetical protein
MEPPPPPNRRRRIAGYRAIAVGSAAAFMGGVLVVGLQSVLSVVSARYSPIVQGLHCNFSRPAGPATGDLRIEEAELGESSAELVQNESATGRLLPTVSTGDDIVCRIDAPGADYAAWAEAGRVLHYRSGPIDAGRDCQDGEAFAAQSRDSPRLSMCQRFRLTDPGVHTLVVKVMARGIASIDRAQLQFLARTPPASLPTPPPPPLETRLQAKLLLAPRVVTQDKRFPVAELLNEHGLLPTDRDYSFVVYRLAPGEQHVSAVFQAASASNASNTRVAYQPNTRAVTMSFTLRSTSFTLRSGPFVDRWRGRLSGNVVVKLTREEAGQSLGLPDIALHLPGQSSVPLGKTLSPEALAGARLQLTRSETGSTAETGLGVPLNLDDLEISTRIDDGNLIVDAKPRPGK